MVLINLKQYENVGFQTKTTLKFICKLFHIRNRVPICEQISCAKM